MPSLLLRFEHAHAVFLVRRADQVLSSELAEVLSHAPRGRDIVLISLPPSPSRFRCQHC